MNKRKNIIDVLSMILGISIIIAAVIGIISTKGEASFEVKNMYGDTVKIYGNGLYSYNSILNVASRLGADITGIIVALLLIFLTLWKGKPLWAEILKTSGIICLTYYSALLLFGLTMNQLYFLYALCFGSGVYSSFMAVEDLFDMIVVPAALKEKALKGTGVFLIITGIIVALIWISCILPVTLNGEFGTLLGIQTNEITYGIDFTLTCPLLIMSGIWILQKRDIGYKVALLLLSLLVFVAILVIMQRAYCIKLGVEIPIQALLGLIISFVILGLIAVFLYVRLIMNLKRAAKA